MIKVLDNNSEKQYEDFLMSIPDSLFYASNKFRKFLKEFLNEEDAYFLIFGDDGNIKAALPSFLKKNSEFGNVLNSLPFYGSNGGVIENVIDEKTRLQLIETFYHFAKENKCVSTTIISSPLKPNEAFYETNTQFTLKDSRIGQITTLPDSNNDVDAAVMKIIHYKMRNLIRKAQKLEIKVEDGNGNQEAMAFLIKTHKENLAAIGGLAKPDVFFNLIPKYFSYGNDYKIYIAKKDGQMIAAMLVFYFNKTVEYFTPVIKAEFRNSQALSLVIFEAMKSAVASGYKWWNWGGTWASQGGVYHFKSQWGTKDLTYYYYTKIFDDKILDKTKEQLLDNYPYFFVAPFNALKPKLN
ncbi:MAG: peptidoglycan bridge formation glycyltransferase FemA/FemB family protein [Bacteroidetes bacterium]|nr:peptidoglycan bridge formation glycyltransferase FemA/FemB family protein [Bacteroidota bacterium]